MGTTSKSLVVVESPAKAKTISRFLGSGYVVEPSYGHVRDLPQNAKEIPAQVRDEEWARIGVNVDADFEPIYVVPSDKKQHVKRLKDALKGADALLLATDEDREGESISWHVLQLLKPAKGLDVRRIVFHEVTPEAISAALRSPRDLDENLVRAQEARRVVDRLYGYSLSPLLWKRIAPGLSAGRVQSVAVRFLVERERERIAFVSSDYWDLRADLQSKDGSLRARLVRLDGQRLADGKSFDSATGKLKQAQHVLLTEPLARQLAGVAASTTPWRVSVLERSPVTQRAAPPFITSTLQQEANRKLRMTARQTMQTAQRLYEGIDLGGERVGLITYMRTDSVVLAERAIEQARQVIADIYGPEFLPADAQRYKTKAKRAQEAHEAIRPTDLRRRPADVQPYLNSDEYRLYELVWKRTIACQMLPAELERTSVEVTVAASGRELTFASSGRRIVFPGFLRAYVEGSDDPEAELGDQESLLPALDMGQVLRAERVEAEGHSTKPPYRYTEASLVKALEEEGIGRPSTYASIISTILDRDYAFKRNNELVPTFTAFCVTELLEKQFSDLVDTRFTARMEDDLDDVAEGKIAWVRLVSQFFHGGGAQPGLQQRLQDVEVIYPEILLGSDPETGESLVIKVGKYGPYVRRGEGGARNVANLPEGIAPDELTLKLALELLKSKNDEIAPVAIDAASRRPITLKVGRFGEYLELGQTEAEKEAGEKPRRVSLPKGLTGEDLTPQIAQQLIGLPRILGVHPADGAEISTNIGRYGPYVKKGDDFRSLDSWQTACTLTLAQALPILEQPKPGRGRQQKVVLREIGPIDGTTKPLQILEGRYGPYVTDGETHASLPRGMNPDALTLDQAAALLEARRGAPKKSPAKRSKATAKAAPKATAKAAPKAGAKKPRSAPKAASKR